MPPFMDTLARNLFKFGISAIDSPMADLFHQTTIARKNTNLLKTESLFFNGDVSKPDLNAMFVLSVSPFLLGLLLN